MNKTVHISEIIKAAKPKQPKKRNYYLVPDMTGRDIHLSIMNYDLFADNYNKLVKDRNKAIKEYNNNYNSANLQPKHIELAEDFEKKYKMTSTIQYNEEAIKWNKIYGAQLIKLRKHITLKPASAIVFAEIIKQQARDITHTRHVRTQMGMSTRLDKGQALDMLISRNKIAGKGKESGLTYTPQTVGTHVKRFVWAGVLTKYQFRGSDKRFMIQINPEILVISDMADRKTQNPQNQFFNSSKKQKLTHSVPSCSEHFKENKGNSAEKIDTQKKESLNSYPADNALSSAMNTTSKSHLSANAQSNEQITAAPADSKETKYQRLTKRLRLTILHYIILANSLFRGIFDNYTPIRNDILKLEVLYGTLTNDEFRQVVVSEFIKTAAKLWKDWRPGNSQQPKRVFVGEWINAIKLIQKTYFLNNNGTVPHKDTLLKMLIYNKKALKKTMNYKNLHPNWTIQSPVNYFNPYQKSTGIAKAKQLLQKQAQRDKQTDKNLKDLENKAFKAEQMRKLWSKIDYRIGRVWSGEMSVTEFNTWIRANVSGITTAQITQYINDKKEKLTA